MRPHAACSGTAHTRESRAALPMPRRRTRGSSAPTTREPGMTAALERLRHLTPRLGAFQIVTVDLPRSTHVPEQKHP